jgi:RNA polymerase sigma factor (TIGR02999 family)
MAQSSTHGANRRRQEGTSRNQAESATNGQRETKTGSRLPASRSRAERAEEVAGNSAGREEGEARIAVDELIATVYRELRQIAHHHLRRERRGHTLNTTALVNEAYVKLAALDHIVWRDRGHFLSIAARAMRRVLVDYAVARKTQKRGGAGQRVSLDDVAIEVEPRIDDLIAIDGALTRLEQLNSRLARVVECRFFAGMSIEEAAGALALSAATVKRDWGVARAWLNKELEG